MKHGFLAWNLTSGYTILQHFNPPHPDCSRCGDIGIISVTSPAENVYSYVFCTCSGGIDAKRELDTAAAAPFSNSRREDGLCMTCGLRPPMEDSYECEECDPNFVEEE